MRTLRSLSVAGLVMLAVGLVCSYAQGAVPLDDESMGMLRGGTPAKYACISNQTCQHPICALGPPGGGSCGRCNGGASLLTCDSDPLYGADHCRDDIPEPSGCGEIIDGATCWMDFDGIYRCMFGDPESHHGTCGRKGCETW